MTIYPIIANCNFESRDDVRGRAIDAARRAAESGLAEDADLIASLQNLEETLGRLADKGDVASIQSCRDAEQSVQSCWTEEIEEAADEVRQSRYID